MKTLLMTALILSAAFGTVNAKADDGISSDYYAMEGKINAADFDITADSIQKHIKELNDMQAELTNLEDSQGLIKAIGQSVHIATLDFKTAKRNFDLATAKKINTNLVEDIRTFKAMDPRNEILGLHPIDGLGD